MNTSALREAAGLGAETSLRAERFGALAYDYDTRRLSFIRRRAESSGRLTDEFERGLDAPICLTWELTYACNLACIHCLSSSGRRDPRELTTEECKRVIDELERMQVFYVNIGGGEPTVRRDFWEFVDYAVAHHVGVKFSTNGSRITPERAARLAGSDYVDVQVSLDGASAGSTTSPRPGFVRHRDPRDGEPGGSRLRRVQAVGRRHARERAPAGCVQGAGGRVRGAAAADPPAPVGARRRRVGPGCTRPRRSSASSTTGCWPTAKTS